jgi:BirA family biotin operon repressor/biotin-[acetyl-CoA-carboxylase] ligase
VNIVQLEMIDSTNEEARRRAEAGETGPLWITAREQTGGRGRRGRTWVSQPGNLFATLLITPQGAIENRAQLSFVTGLAAADTVAIYAENVALKWPNDVLLNGHKVAGILLESFGNALAVGFGINLAHAPKGTDFPATSIASVSATPSPKDALASLARAWDAWYEVWLRHGFAPVRGAWLGYAWGLGEPIRVRLMDREMDGLFASVDTDGALLVRRPDGALARVSAGDVMGV